MSVIASGLSVMLVQLPAYAASQIVIGGSVSQNCTMNVTTDPQAANLNLTGNATRAIVGTVVQSCNKKAGYTIVVTSANCGGGPNGAKMIGAASSDQLSYSVESVNPTTGGSAADVTGILASSCVAQNARVVTNAKISNETSTIYVNYTGNAALSADAYQDTLTFNMTIN